jgi:hypothetical protein
MKYASLFFVLFGMLNQMALGQSVPEKNGFIVAPPNLYTKQIFRVTEADHPLIESINAASNSIAAFVVEQNNLQNNAAPDQLKHVLPEARGKLRIPPLSRAGQARHYTAIGIHSWKKIGPDRLGFAIEYADPAAPRAHYLDHYVFVRQGDVWLFERHGELPARSWRQSASAEK